MLLAWKLMLNQPDNFSAGRRHGKDSVISRDEALKKLLAENR